MNRKQRAACVVGLFFLFAAGRTTAATVMVDVAPGGPFFLPDSVTIQAGDTVMWTWKDGGHSVTSGYPGQPSGVFDSGVHGAGFSFSFTFQNAGMFLYYCMPHGSCCGMTGAVTVTAATPTPTPTPLPTPTPDPTVPAQALNISTRLEVRTGDQVLIGALSSTAMFPRELFSGRLDRRWLRLELPIRWLIRSWNCTRAMVL
jgi:plastocyanin